MTDPMPTTPPTLPTLEQRVLTEAVCRYEDNRGEAVDDTNADAQGRAVGGDFERRVIARAQALPLMPTLAQALKELLHATGLVLIGGLVLALLAGITAAHTALGPGFGTADNFFWVLGGVLGIPTLTLLLWTVLVLYRPRALDTGSLGGLLLVFARRLTRRLHPDSAHVAVVQASGILLTRTQVGRWTLSAFSHALWLAFGIGALLTVLILLGTRQYAFNWETTILSERSYVPITRLLAQGPELLGFTGPTPEQIRASRHTDADHQTPEAASEAWSTLLVGSILVYGILPRLFLLLLSLGLAWWAARQFRLDLSQTGYLRLQSRLQPGLEALGVVDPDTVVATPAPAAAPEPEPESEPEPAAEPELPGPLAVLGLEIEPPPSGWPPPATGADWLDLGLIDSREQRHVVLDRLQQRPLPRLTLAVCSLAATPDRGTRSFLTQLHDAAKGELALLLTEGQRLRARGHPDEVTQRSADWLTLAAAAGIPAERVLELDLDHLTDTSRANLERLLGLDAVTPAAQRQLNAAFDLIADHTAHWQNLPNAAEQAELHRAIAQLYRHRGRDWQHLLRARPTLDVTQLNAQLKGGADRMINLLPARLRLNPRWLAAGATAGALSCVAAATLVTPAAIAALPLWAGLGAALAQVLPSREEQPAPAAAAGPDLSDAVHAAALFALLLELQGRSEAAITRIIDRIAADDPAALTSAAAVRARLDELQRRFDLALAEESFA